MALVWVTGNSGTGKSILCTVLEERGHLAVDTDEDGYCHWVDRETGRPVVDPPDPVPDGWLDDFGWRISRAKLEALAIQSRDRKVFVCGSAENEAEVLDLFDFLVCLVVDDETLKQRLASRTTNDFGKNPEELAAALCWNPRQEEKYGRLGATIIDGRSSAAEVADVTIAALTQTSFKPLSSNPTNFQQPLNVLIVRFDPRPPLP